MQRQYFPQRLCMLLAGIFAMAMGVALSCKADLGTSPISSVPWVLSMFTPWSVGQWTIGMNLFFIAAQPLLLRKLYWQELLGQFLILLVFGSAIDFSMFLISWFTPTNLAIKWTACIISAAILGLGVFLCIRAKIFVNSGEGIVLVLSFVTKIKFSIVKNCFDITLVIISIVISMSEFGSIEGIGLGTIAAAILVGRFVQLCTNYLHCFDKWAIEDK